MKVCKRGIGAFAILSVIFLAGFFWMGDTDVRGKVDKSYSTQEFLNIFQESGNRNLGYVSGAASRFVMDCCREYDIAMNLLADSGFDVRVVSEPSEVARISEHWGIAKGSVQKFAFAKRRPFGWMGWRIFTQYGVALSINEGEVTSVKAWANTTFP